MPYASTHDWWYVEYLPSDTAIDVGGYSKLYPLEDATGDFYGIGGGEEGYVVSAEWADGTAIEVDLDLLVRRLRREDEGAVDPSAHGSTWIEVEVDPERLRVDTDDGGVLVITRLELDLETESGEFTDDSGRIDIQGYYLAE